MSALRIFCSVMVLTIGGAALLSPPAEAVQWTVTKPEDGAVRNHQLDLVAGVSGGHSLGATPGVVYGLPIVGDGFIGALNDSFYLQLGAYFPLYLGGTFGAGAIPVGGVRWNFHLTPQWDVFWTAMGGWNVGLTGYDSLPFYSTSVGGHYKFSEGTYLRLETGSFGYATVGLSIQM